MDLSMDPLLVPLVTELNRLAALRHALDLWKATALIERLECSKETLVRNALDQAAHRLTDGLQWFGPGMNALAATLPDNYFLRTAVAIFAEAGPRMAFTTMRACQEGRRHANATGFRSTFEDISDDLWRRAFRLAWCLES